MTAVASPVSSETQKHHVLTAEQIGPKLIELVTSDTAEELRAITNGDETWRPADTHTPARSVEGPRRDRGK